jgi:Ni,Fe-hydrogenase I large subunit
VLGRHAARALESKLVADAMVGWLMQLKPDEPSIVQAEVPDTGESAGLTEAPRGAVGHWMTIKGKKIHRYQVITPTAWNASPKDDKDQPGAIEQAIIGTKVRDKDNPFEVVRIVRAFDPCLACSVHLLDFKGNELGIFRVV